MPSMTVPQIEAALAQNSGEPDRRARAARAEYLVEAAGATGNRPLEIHALQELIGAYEYSGESDRMLVPFARVLRHWDEAPGDFDAYRRHLLFWHFKWATGRLIWQPQVPLATLRHWLGEMQSRYRQAGYSARPVHQARHYLADHLGDDADAERGLDAWLAQPRDQMADCEACERNGQGDWLVRRGRDADALEAWHPVLAGELACEEEPHRLLGSSLLPLVRLGRLDEARANHLRGYRMARGKPSLRATVAAHLEFCALTGNEARGLEILAEHAAWLQPSGENLSGRRAFLEGVSVLLHRLIDLGHGALPVPAGAGPASSVAELAALADEQVSEICAAFDARNGNTTQSTRSAGRFGQRPLVAALPLGSAAPLTRPAGPADGRQDPAPSAVSGPASVSPLGELVAQAERLSAARHPHAPHAWERVAHSGFELPPPVAARIEAVRARSLVQRDPAAARAAQLDAARRFAELGDPVSARESRAAAAFAAFLAGEDAVAHEEAAALGDEAQAAYAAGELTPRQYLGVRNLPVFLAFNAIARQAEAGTEGYAADPALAEGLLLAELELADRLGDPGRAGTYCQMLARIAFVRRDRAAVGTWLEAAVERFTAGAQPWDAVEAHVQLGQLALEAGDARAAEGHARAALEHGAGPVDPPAAANTASLLVAAISGQPDRELDLVDAALRAAQRWEGISEPDTLHNRFTAARAYYSLGRYGEAAALFEDSMPRVEVPYDRTGIAMTREQYGDCLSRLGEHRKAAEQFLTAAALLQDDPANPRAHARLAWAAAEALQEAQLPQDALAAFRRTAELWGALGEPAARARCLRSAAWLLTWQDADHEPQWPQAVAAMRAVLAELRAVPAGEGADAIGEELDHTARQLEQMLDHQREYLSER